MQRTELTEDYSISKIIKGGWQLAGGHGAIDPDQAIADMFAYYDAGITTFDCADIYTGVEDLIGKFIRKLSLERGSNELINLQVHTKYVPNRQDLGKITYSDVERSIRCSVNRLGVERLDLVQFHWWDFSIHQYVEVAMMLSDLQRKGLIRHIGLTNFDPVHIQELAKAGVRAITNQVQYSVLDRRPEKSLEEHCASNNMSMLCYGGLAGGFIGDRYLGVAEPDFAEIHSNRSLIKYKLIVDDLGGWAELQNLLEKLNRIGKSHGLNISEVALLYVLSKPYVGAVIVGARDSRHVQSLSKLTDQNLTVSEIAEIDHIFGKALLKGDIYELERTDEKHATIMRYNLNKGDA